MMVRSIFRSFQRRYWVRVVVIHSSERSNCDKWDPMKWRGRREDEEKKEVSHADRDEKTVNTERTRGFWFGSSGCGPDRCEILHLEAQDHLACFVVVHGGIDQRNYVTEKELLCAQESWKNWKLEKEMRPEEPCKCVVSVQDWMRRSGPDKRNRKWVERGKTDQSGRGSRSCLSSDKQPHLQVDRLKPQRVAPKSDDQQLRITNGTIGCRT
jgi:hypothetical protein